MKKRSSTNKNSLQARKGNVTASDLRRCLYDLRRFLGSVKLLTIYDEASGGRKFASSPAPNALSALHAEILPRFEQIAHKLLHTPSERVDPDFKGPVTEVGGRTMIEGGGDPILYTAVLQIIKAMDYDTPSQLYSGRRNRYLLDDLIIADKLKMLESSEAILKDIVEGHEDQGRERRRGPKVRYDPSTDERRVADWKASGLSRSEFERARGLPVGSVRKAKDRMKARSQREQT